MLDVPSPLCPPHATHSDLGSASAWPDPPTELTSAAQLLADGQARSLPDVNSRIQIAQLGEPPSLRGWPSHILPATPGDDRRRSNTYPATATPE